jgi:hypothetical protein
VLPGEENILLHTWHVFGWSGLHSVYTMPCSSSQRALVLGKLVEFLLSQMVALEHFHSPLPHSLQNLILLQTQK